MLSAYQLPYSVGMMNHDLYLPFVSKHMRAYDSGRFSHGIQFLKIGGIHSVPRSFAPDYRDTCNNPNSALSFLRYWLALDINYRLGCRQ